MSSVVAKSLHKSSAKFICSRGSPTISNQSALATSKIWNFCTPPSRCQFGAVRKPAGRWSASLTKSALMGLLPRPSHSPTQKQSPRMQLFDFDKKIGVGWQQSSRKTATDSGRCDSGRKRPNGSPTAATPIQNRYFKNSSDTQHSEYRSKRILAIKKEALHPKVKLTHHHRHCQVSTSVVNTSKANGPRVCLFPDDGKAVAADDEKKTKDKTSKTKPRRNSSLSFLSGKWPASCSGDGHPELPALECNGFGAGALRLNTPIKTEILNRGVDAIDNKSHILGRGGFGVVVSAIRKDQQVALKIITKNPKRRRSIDIAIHNEENAIELCHPNVVQTYDIFGADEQQKNAIIVMEFAGSTHLAKILENPLEIIDQYRRLKYDSKKLRIVVPSYEFQRLKSAQLEIRDVHILRHHQWEGKSKIMTIDDDGEVLICEDVCTFSKNLRIFLRKLGFAFQVACALQWCHHKQIAHLDVKPANVIVNDNDLCKLGDFGCSRRLDHNFSFEDWHLVGGTISYRAPELLRNIQPTLKADVYSFAITLWQLLSREIPFNGIDQHVIVYRVVAYDARPESPTVADASTMEYINLYRRLWVRSEALRPPMEDVLSIIQRFLLSA